MTTDARDQFDRTAAGYSVSRAHSASESLRLFKEFAGDRRYGVALDIATGSGFYGLCSCGPVRLRECKRYFGWDVGAGGKACWRARARERWQGVYRCARASVW